MVEKIITLVFGLILLAVTVILSLDNPSVENYVAVACSAVIVVASVVGLVRKDYVELVQNPSKGKRPIDNGMMFQNDIVPYIKRRGDKLILRVKK